jgi:signal transduction histidine kinase
MGSRGRGRSIRLRIYFLVTIPLVLTLGLFAYVAVTTITNYVNLDRAPTLTEATAVRSTIFVKLLQAERRAALVYLSNPTPSTRSQYMASVSATKNGAASFEQAMNSPTVKQAEDNQEAEALGKFIGDVNNMTKLRLGVEAQKISPIVAFAGYSDIVTDEPVVFQAEASSLTNTTAATTGMGLISSVNAREDLDQQDALLAGALASGKLTNQARVVFNQAAGREQDDDALARSLLSKSEVTSLDDAFASPQIQAAQKSFTKVQEAVEAGTPLGALQEQGLTGPAWQQMTSALANANYNGGLAAATGTLSTDFGNAHSARNRIYVIGAFSLAGLLLTLLVTILLGRSINRRLTVLRRTATALATEHLPGVVARLRRGENVDVAAAAPPLRVGADEIGQVGQAFDMVRQTALRSAVEESRLRQGVNDMFRNLARRNQSLLQRQLTMLDGMERRATDPDVLDDLFKMDHLTTRMRRHAEGLIILSGATPGRGWSTPVKLIDVMRGAVAEVEDFARVLVTTQSKATLTGAAVTDVIHLLAELIENATTLSPPFTQVRVHGEMVGNGFAIEIEDRGLGMTPMRTGELNERLANPPDVNPANTEQLGLFVVGQLARRHGLKVVLRPSPYGGTTAVVMIPQRLVVDDATPAIDAGSTGPQAAVPGAVGAFGANGPSLNGFNGSRAAAGGNSFGGSNGSSPFVAPSASSGLGGNGGHRPGGSFPGSAGAPAGSSPAASGNPPDLDNIPISSPFGTSSLSANSGPGRGGQRWPDDPVITGVPVTKPTVRPPFSDFPSRRGSDGGATLPTRGGTSSAANEGHSSGSGYSSSPSYSSSSFYGSGNASADSSGSGQYDTGGSGSYDTGNGYGNNGGAREGYGSGDVPGSGTDEFKGLPRRMRQANLAPQLRNSSAGETGVPQASVPNPADVKNTLSAMQRGWQQGRAQSQRDTEGNNGI